MSGARCKEKQNGRQLLRVEILPAIRFTLFRKWLWVLLKKENVVLPLFNFPPFSSRTEANCRQAVSSLGLRCEPFQPPDLLLSHHWLFSLLCCQGIHLVANHSGTETPCHVQWHYRGCTPGSTRKQDLHPYVRYSCFFPKGMQDVEPDMWLWEYRRAGSCDGGLGSRSKK